MQTSHHLLKINLTLPSPNIYVHFWACLNSHYLLHSPSIENAKVYFESRLLNIVYEAIYLSFNPYHWSPGVLADHLSSRSSRTFESWNLWWVSVLSEPWPAVTTHQTSPCVGTGEALRNLWRQTSFQSIPSGHSGVQSSLAQGAITLAVASRLLRRSFWFVWASGLSPVSRLLI